MDKQALIQEVRDPKNKKDLPALLKEHNHYSAHVSCTNCGVGLIQSFVVQCGELLLDAASQTVCPICGVKGHWERFDDAVAH